MRFFYRLSYVLGCTLLLASCSSTKMSVDDEARDDWRGARGALPPPGSDVVYRIFLIGNTGGATREGASVLALLKAQLDVAGEQSTVLFLGNQVGNFGFPDSASVNRAKAEALLIPQLEAVKNFRGNVFFVPGNLDWDNGRSGGLGRLHNQEEFVETYLDRGNVFLPDNGFPGPVKVKLTKEITLLAIDTQWWMTQGEKSFGDTGEYNVYEAGDFLRELKDAILKNRKKDLLVIGHHPLHSNGQYGGRFSAQTHLTPLPVIGSVVPLYRRFIGTRQDMAHVKYKELREEMGLIFKDEEDLIYASSHDRSLQYFETGTFRGYQHHLVSGAGSGADFVASENGAAFTASESGFMKLLYYRNHSIWMEAWAPRDEEGNGRLLFRDQLKESVPEIVDPNVLAVEESYPDYQDSTMVQAANPRYAKAGFLKRAIFGGHNRDLWGIPVSYPLLDLTREGNGLTPTKFGGSGQSVTVRLEGTNGKDYVLRSIDKVAGKMWSHELRETFVHSILQDQMSMFHPYGAFIVPPLADAIGVYHTNPKYVMVPDDPRMGIYRDRLAGRLMLFEERPDGDMSDVASMGFSEDIVSYRTLYKELDKDNDNRVDSRMYARARLLDMLISDWDRHKDQWRWAAFENDDGGTSYRPVPRDRDLAFNRFSGLFGVVGKLMFQPNYQDFRKHYGYLRGLNRNSFAQDRPFTSGLTESDWIMIADSIRIQLTDDVIELAVRQLPPEVFDLHGEKTMEVLKIRRDKLPDVARRHYQILASVVDVVGSDKHERFEVTRLDGDRTEVVVYKTKKEGDIRRELYRRTFHGKETRELRLYGLGGQDRFIVNGSVDKGILVRIVGGTGEDSFTDSSRVKGHRKMTRIYDSNANNYWQTGPETKVYRSDETKINAYKRNSFSYNLTRPTLFFGRNKDDGVFIGGGVKITSHGFRKNPHASTHEIMANMATKTQAFNFRYIGHYSEVLGEWGVRLTGEVLTPNTIHNFYGLGNETTSEEGDAKFYQAQFSNLNIGVALEDNIQGANLSVGSRFNYTNVEEDGDRFVGQPQAGVSPSSFDPQWFGSLEINVSFSTVDSGVNPKQGIRLQLDTSANIGLHNASQTFYTLAPSMTLYLSPSLSPQWTVAIRAGGAHNIGEFPFYSASTLGGAQNLRGFRSTRFAGRTSFYTNTEVRGKLFHIARYLGFGDIGVLGFVDQGRVWTDGETSDKWHNGYGGGVWFEAFEAMVLTSTFAFSKNDNTFTIAFGFLF
ncbi:MAG: BamA/TamA family outer membrane protein [Bacteroidetes bacterium]|nr:BamA/TamA family outer membrane protein [Bacteroidota bacterium]